MSLKNLKTRINYMGGARQVDRMIEDKQRSLNKSLLYSYQSATAVLRDGREFRCLINPDKLDMETDDKILSIPFRDICLNKARPDGATTSQGKEEIGVKCGDVIEWKENGTHWIIYSQLLQEVAYFRGHMRQCEDEALDIGGEKFWYYLKGPDEKSIDWQKSKHFIFNDLNYSVEIYISNTEITKQFFQRFAKIKIQGRNFEVQAVDDLSTKGILTVFLKEDYSNAWEEAPKDNSTPPTSGVSEITGPAQVYPYDIAHYEAPNSASGAWSLSNTKACIVEQTGNAVTIEITTGKSGSVDLIYNCEGREIVYPITILSL